MKIIGIDPGIALTGYGIVELKNNIYNVIDYGKIETFPEMLKTQRLEKIYNDLSTLFLFHRPDVLALEELFFNKNSKTAITVGEARGVIILCATQHNIPVFEYTPLQVKQAITGYGRAEKVQMQRMIKMILNLNETPKPDDVADALGIAVCHGNYCSSSYYVEGKI